MPKPRPLKGFLFLFVFGFLVGFAPPQQSPILSMEVDAGFDGAFRDGAWFPVIVQVRNDGDAAEGRLVIRPETSGAGFTNTYSVPVTLPNGANQTVLMYATARSFANQVRVEFIDNADRVVTAASDALRAIQPLDRLYGVISQSPAGSVDLTGAAFQDYNAYQVNWRIQDLPDKAAALGSVDTLLFSDVDTGSLSSAQQSAIEDWVASGGHLIVTGGAAWQQTAAGLLDLLPLVPGNTQTVEALNSLQTWLNTDASGDLTGQTVLATGNLTEDAEVLRAEGDVPLLARRSYGAGTVDYLAADPNTRPLRGWGGLTDLWYTLETLLPPQPAWSYGFYDWEMAAGSTEIIPGFNPLPEVLPLCGFLALYIALIGPVNYFILARLGRRELAWLTIPLLIVVFSALSWVLGFNLRGNEATLSRLNMVQSWPDVERANVNGLVGLLSPRRGQYSLTANTGELLRPVPRLSQGNLLTANTQVSVDIQQSDVFRAADFAVDASFIAGFNVSGTIPRPELGGSASIAYARDGQRVRGSVRNDSDQTLEDPVILARGIAYTLGETLEAGDVATFDITLPGETAPTPLNYSPSTSGLLYGSAYTRSSYYGGPFGYGQSGQTVTDILGQDPGYSANPEDQAFQEDRRRRLFLSSLISDFNMYGNYSSVVSTGRGDEVYLVGWTDESPLPIELQGAGWLSADTTVYLVQLETEHTMPANRVTVTADRFTWSVEDRSTLSSVMPMNLSLQPGEQATFRYTPLPDAVLDEVETLTIRLEGASVGSARLPIYLYNWKEQEFEEVNLRQDGTVSVNNPARFLGPENAVLVRVDADQMGSYLRADRLLVEQRGHCRT